MILDNAFFGFWLAFGNYFFAVWAAAILLSIFLGLAYFLTRR